MKETINGSCIAVSFEADELASHVYLYELPAGYSLKTIRISSATNITYVTPWSNSNTNAIIMFPVVNSRSPSKLHFYIPDITKKAFIYIDIMEFGQIPDPHYFDKAFEPILVTGDDGKEYNVIPSDQFK
jgi:hypothetical protein